MKVIEIEYNGVKYQRYTNPPEDRSILIRWKVGNIRVYDKISEQYWWEWKWSGRWKNELKWTLCDEPVVEKIYQQTLNK
jgi:hypothetical protein